MEPTSIAYLSAAFAMGIAATATAFAIGHLVAKSVEGTARQPEAAADIRTTMIIGTAFIEAIALYTLVVSFLLILR